MSSGSGVQHENLRHRSSRIRFLVDSNCCPTETVASDSQPAETARIQFRVTVQVCNVRPLFRQLGSTILPLSGRPSTAAGQQAEHSGKHYGRGSHAPYHASACRASCLPSTPLCGGRGERSGPFTPLLTGLDSAPVIPPTLRTVLRRHGLRSAVSSSPTT